VNIQQLADEKVFLRRFTQADAALVQKFAGDFAVADTTLRIPHPYPDGAAEKWIATHAAMFEQATGAVFAITTQPDQKLAGCIGIEVNRADNSGEIGYWIGQPFWRQGYCTAALRLFLPYCFSKLDLHRIQAHHLARNPASGRVMEKAGLRREGFFREHILKSGKYEDVVFYGLLRSDYKNTKV
jgi:ribosomal-protein-alanine N-acetyltransferase